jgi:hypothetical protein
MIVSDARKPFEMDDRPTESRALVLKASLGRSVGEWSPLTTGNK